MTEQLGSSSNRINFVRTGPRGRPPIVFLHALGLDLSIWEPQIEAFGRHHDVIAVDLPGHGLSEASIKDLTFESFAAELVDLLTELKTGPAHVVGISVGGMIAQTLAVAAPACVCSLTLVATSCTFPEVVRTVLKDRARIAREAGMDTIALQHLERWFLADFRMQRPEILDRFRKILLRQPSTYHADMWDMVSTLNTCPQLSMLQCPTLVVAGEGDASASPAAGQTIVDHIGGSSLHVVTKCGHFPPLEHPIQFNALLSKFIARLT